MGKQGCYERIARSGKTKTKKDEHNGKQRAEPDCLGSDEGQAERVVALDRHGHRGYRGPATSSENALVAEELFFCTHVPKIPPAWAELYITTQWLQPPRGSSFSCTIYYQTGRQYRVVTILSRRIQTRAPFLAPRTAAPKQ